MAYSLSELTTFEFKWICLVYYYYIKQQLIIKNI